MVEVSVYTVRKIYPKRVEEREGKTAVEIAAPAVQQEQRVVAANIQEAPAQPSQLPQPPPPPQPSQPVVQQVAEAKGGRRKYGGKYIGGIYVEPSTNADHEPSAPPPKWLKCLPGQELYIGWSDADGRWVTLCCAYWAEVNGERYCSGIGQSLAGYKKYGDGRCVKKMIQTCVWDPNEKKWKCGGCDVNFEWYVEDRKYCLKVLESIPVWEKIFC